MGEVERIGKCDLLGWWQWLSDGFIRSLFGDDIFISYSRKDTAYVLRLANTLVDKGISPYVDQWASPVGAELPPILKRALARAKMLLVVATVNSATSENVELEILHFLSTYRPVCVVDVAGALRDARWRRLILGPEPIAESHASITATTPSPDVVSRILSAARFTRSKTLLRVYSVGALCFILLGVAGASYFGWRAKTARDEESAAKYQAKKEKKNADDQQARAAMESLRAVAASKKANDAAILQKLAESKRDEAQKEAERINRFSTSRILASTSKDVVAMDPLVGLHLGVQALDTAPTPEAESALRFALATPRPWRILPGHYRDLDFGLNDFFTLGVDSTLTQWDLKSGKLKWILPARGVLTAEWSNDGRQIVTASRDGAVEIWDAQTGGRRGDIQFEAGFVSHASFDADDLAILTAHPDGKVRRISIGTGRQLSQLELKAPIERVWLKGNYLTVWVKSENTFQRAVWFVETADSRLNMLDATSISYFDPPVRSNGRWMVLSDQIQDGQRILESIGSNRLSGKHLAVTTDGSLAMTAWEDYVVLWALWTKSPLMRLPRHESKVVWAGFSRSGDSFATLSEQGITRVWKVPHRIMTIPTSRPTLKEVVSMSFSNDGRTLATADKWGDFILWDMATGESRDLLAGPKALRAERSRVAFDKSGKFLFASTELGRAEVWDWRSRDLQLSRTLSNGSIPRFSREGRMLVSAPQKGGALILDLVNDTQKLRDPGTTFCDAAPTPDGNFIITSSFMKGVRVHRTSTWEVVAHLENSFGKCNQIEVDENEGDNVLLFTPQKAKLWQWREAHKVMDIDNEGRPVIGARFFGNSPFFTIATQSDARVYDLRNHILLQKMNDDGRSNTAVALNGVDRLVATTQVTFNSDYYVFLRLCPSCVDRGLLRQYSEDAITALAEEEKHISKKASGSR